MPQGTDDFTIVLPELTEIAAGELKVYYGVDRLWRMVERYKMTAPIAVRVVDNKARCVRTIRGNRYQAASWQLEDESTAVEPPPGGEVEFPLSINVQDAKGNILKMRAQVGVPKPDSFQTIFTIDRRARWLRMSRGPLTETGLLMEDVESNWMWGQVSRWPTKASQGTLLGDAWNSFY